MSTLSRRDPFVVGLTLAGAVLVAFVLLPLAGTVLGCRPAAVWASLTEPAVLRSIWLTFYAGGWATLLATLTGVPLAYLLARYRFPGRELVQGLVNLPVVIPHTAAGIALLMVFGRRGLLGQLFLRLGIGFVDSTAGIVVAMLFVSLPLLVSGAREAFAMVDPELELMALTEGADRRQAFWHITLPLAGRGIAAGAVMMWARGISEFGAVVILAYHPQIVPVLVYERFQGFGLDASLPITVILILVALIVFVLLRTILTPDRATRGA